MSDPTDKLLRSLEAVAEWFDENGDDSPKGWAANAVMNAHAEIEGCRANIEQLEKWIEERDLEIERLRAGGCARDQRTTQFCAEAAMLSRQLEVCKDAWIKNVQATDLVRDQRDELERELERVKVALANALSERDGLREALGDTRTDNGTNRNG